MQGKNPSDGQEKQIHEVKIALPPGVVKQKQTSLQGRNFFDAGNVLPPLCRRGSSNNEIFFKISEND